MTNERLLMRAREARRAKATASAEKKEATKDGGGGGGDNVIPSASSFVRPSTNASGKITMNWQELQASLTPPRPPRKSTSSGLTPSRSLSRPRSSPMVKSKTPIKSRAKTPTKPVARRPSSVTLRRERISGSSNPDGARGGVDRASLGTKRRLSKLRKSSSPPGGNSDQDSSSSPRDTISEMRPQSGSSLQSRISSGILASNRSPDDDKSNNGSVTRRASAAAAKLAARRRTSSKSPVALAPLDSEQTSAHGPGTQTLVTPTQGLAFEFERETEPTSGEASGSSSGHHESEMLQHAPKVSALEKKTVPHKKTADKTPPLSSSAPARQRTKRRSVGAKSITPEGRTPLTQLPLSVQREKERKREQKLASRNEADTSESSRRNLDKRTARLRYSGDFKADILKHLEQSPFQSNGSRPTSSAIRDNEKNGVSIFVRKRPIFQHELDRSDYDVVSIESSSPDGRLDTVVINNCTMHPDMRRKFVKPMLFPCSVAFSEHSSDDDVYRNVAEPMVQLAARGGVSTILMYGQTGSGKTFTMTGIEQRAASGLFENLGSFNERRAEVAVQFVELAGKSCRDLLGDGEEVKLAEDEDGSVQLLNAVSVQVTSASELAKQISKGKSRRATEATDVNGVSSRSHAVCQLQIRFPTRRQKRGLLTLIDCAGSERRHDSMYHSSVRQKESAEINASLWALKECIRARALASESRRSVVPYRSHNLTRLLRESFERDGAKLCVIATVAPNATDTEHSMETLKTVLNIVGLEKLICEGTAREVSSRTRKKSASLIAPKNYNHDQLVEFLEKKKIKVSVPDRFDGKAVMRMNAQQIRAHFFAGAKKDHSELVFNELRKENDRIAKLQRRERLSISKARKAL